MEIMAVANGKLTTPRAGMRAILGINIDDRNGSLQGLVFNEPLELGEGPGTVDVSLLLPDPCPFPDVSQLLHHNDISFLKAINDPAAYVVVNPAYYPALLARKLFQELLCCSCALGLESLSKMLESPPRMHCLLPWETETVGSGRKIINPQVNPHNLTVILRCWPWNRSRGGDVNVERTFTLNKGGMSRLLPFEKASLVIPQKKRDFNPASDRREGNHFPRLDEAEDPLVIIHRGGVEALDFISLGFVGIGGSGYSPHSKICREPEPLFKFSIAGLLKPEFICRLELFSFLKGRIAGFVECFKRSLKSFQLLWGGSQFAGYSLNCFGKFHLSLRISLLKGGVKGTFLPPFSVGFLRPTL